MNLGKKTLRRAVLALPSNWRLLRKTVSALAFSPPEVSDPLGKSLTGPPMEPVANPHVREALSWLKRAQDHTTDGGVAAYYEALYNPMRSANHGWASPYPETTGYIISTVFDFYQETGDQDLFNRAVRMANWECDVQLPTGAVQAGTIGSARVPAIFNTGQAILGWLRAYDETQDDHYLECARRAGEFLLVAADSDGAFRKHLSPLTTSGPKVYNTRTAWALFELGRTTEYDPFRRAAIANVRWALREQLPNGWFSQNDLGDPEHPLTHTIAYALRGILEIALHTGVDEYLDRVLLTANAIVQRLPTSGALPARFDRDWNAHAPWSCLTGNCQLAVILFKLYQATQDDHMLAAGLRLLHFVEWAQDLTAADPGIRGGISGSFPIDGGYFPYAFQNWATKFFLDAELLKWRILRIRPGLGRSSDD